MNLKLYDPRTIANEFISLCNSNGIQASGIYLVKIVYIAHGYHLAFYNKPLINGDIKAWIYGPNIENIFNEVKGRSKPFTKFMASPHDEIITDIQKSLIKKVFEAYGHLTGLQLATIAHQDESPWRITIDEYGQDSVIPQDLIRSYYEKKAFKEGN